MSFSRCSGILLHPSSLPSRFGIGDLGKVAYDFVDFLEHSQQTLWQILPLGPTGYGNSPYSCFSAMAGNHLLISLEKLVEYELLEESDFTNLPNFPHQQVDFDLVKKVKMPLLEKSFQRLQAADASDTIKQLRGEWQQFCATRSYWLEDYALYMALKSHHNYQSWHEWEPNIAHRQPAIMAELQKTLRLEISFHQYLQFIFYKQWSHLKNYANDRGIKILGDIPIYVAHDSVDVWANPEIFHLDAETGKPALMAGVPPDYFSETGQLWGNPVYNWERLERENFEWWVKRIQVMLEYVDIIRIDHFRGLESFWAVKQGEETAVNGEWLTAPGEKLFNKIQERLGDLPLIAEDLGVMTEEVEILRDKFALPGMKILQFAFDSDAGNPYLPHKYTTNFAVYTGTHDNDTTVGWFNKRSQKEQQKVTRYLGCVSGDGIHWDLIRLAMSSVADLAIFPLQDLFGLDTASRMNEPGKPDGNWGWRFSVEMLTEQIGDRLANLTAIYGRERDSHSRDHN